MIDILEKLKHKEIINDENVLALRKYISINYPHLSSQEASIMFADSIHKILDDNIKYFDKKHHSDIKKALISNSIRKNAFTINADEIFNTIISLDIDSYSCLEDLTDWINENQDIVISKEYLLDFITEIRKYDEKNLKRKDGTKKNSNEDICADDINITYKHSDSKLVTSNNIHRLVKRKNLGIIIGIFLISLFSLTIYIINMKTEKVIPVKADTLIVSEPRNINELPVEFKYIDLDIEKLRIWLDSRDSKLADEPYLSTIVNNAYKFDINPLLLIAITGQEQGFVPRSNENAEKIANNPFNVFGSWIKYNTDIHDSSEIAARTVVNLSKDRPNDIEVIKWINRKYAEDENWHKGVSKIFYMLYEELGVKE